MRTELGVRPYRLAVAVVLAAEAALLTWNAWHYDWLRGYDAYASDRYAEILWEQHRLPSTSESGVWHTPPLWFGAAAGLRASIRSAIDPVDQPAYASSLNSLRAELGEGRFAEGSDEGRAMTLEQAVAYALEDQDD